MCIKRFYWPAYYVQLGDTLFWLAPAVGSSVTELLAANCLTSDQICAGSCYICRLLRSIIAPTDAQTATQTTTDTPSPSATNPQKATSTYTPTPTSTTSITLTLEPTVGSTLIIAAN